MVVDMLSLRPAAEKPPVSTTRLKTSRLVNRSIPSDYPLLSDNRKEFAWIIQQITQAVTSFSFACGFWPAFTAIARQTRQSLWGSGTSGPVDQTSERNP